MIYSSDPQNNEGAAPSSITRTLSTTDFLKLCGRRRSKCRARTSQSSVDLASSTGYGSENSQILYMKAPKRRDRTDGALSSVDNSSGHVMDGSSDARPPVDDNTAMEEISWNIIDREIFEWQYVCQTGRPFWWSPESKYTRLKKIQPRLSNESSPRIWMRDIMDERSKPAYDSQRRAVSDSCLSDPKENHDLAKLIAVQLLGSCFTLPPDQLIGAPSPSYSAFDKGGATLPDPRMISSLRMHTHFRYSPCFGHQARNTSPVQLWPGRYDGQTPNPSPPPTASGPQTPYIQTSELSHRRERERRVLYVTENSREGRFLDSDTDGYSRSEAEFIRPAMQSKRRAKVNAKKFYDGINNQYRGKKNCRYRPQITHPPSSADAEETVVGYYRRVQSCQVPNTNYRLHPVIRSEPHPVYVQPVKELVVKRWKTFRRRFGGSLNGPLLSGDESPASESGHSGCSSSAMSCDGRERRRRARERGEIHSSSVDDTVHSNSPASGNLSPNKTHAEPPYWVDSRNATSQFHLADPLVAAAALVAAQSCSTLNQSQHSIPSPPNNTSSSIPAISSGVETSSSSNTSSATSGNVPQKTEMAYYNPLKQPITSSAHSFASKRESRKRRKSMLSEVCTPEDFRQNIVESDQEVVNRCIPGAVGSTFTSPPEEPEPISLLQLPHQWLDVVGFPGQVSPIGESLMVERPRVTRTSTSGSQIFTPNEDGVEVDGLPVGPSKYMWTQKGYTREKT